MNPIILMWSVAKLYEFFLFLFVRFWKVWAVLLVLEGFVSVTSDTSLVRRIFFYDSNDAEIQRVFNNIDKEATGESIMK